MSTSILYFNQQTFAMTTQFRFYVKKTLLDKKKAHFLKTLLNLAAVDKFYFDYKG